MSDNFKIYNFIFLSYHWLAVISALIEVGRDPLEETRGECLQQKYNYFYFRGYQSGAGGNQQKPPPRKLESLYQTGHGPGSFN